MAQRPSGNQVPSYSGGPLGLRRGSSGRNAPPNPSGLTGRGRALAGEPSNVPPAGQSALVARGRGYSGRHTYDPDSHYVLEPPSEVPAGPDQLQTADLAADNTPSPPHSVPGSSRASEQPMRPPAPETRAQAVPTRRQGIPPQASDIARSTPQPIPPPSRILEQSGRPQAPETGSAPALRPGTSTSMETLPLITARDDLHPHWYIRCILYLVGFLHTRHRVTFRSCALVLTCLGFIFSVLGGNLIGAVAMPRTLKAIFARLDMKDRFAIHPICYRCHRIFDVDIGALSFCPDCDEEIFGAADSEESDADLDSDSENSAPHQSSRSVKHKPTMVAPIQPLSSGLQGFFKRPGMVSAVNSWKRRPRVNGELSCMQDAEVWRTIKGPDGRSFFFDPAGEKEIRLGVSFSLDWFRPSKSSFGPSHSSGVMSFCIQNLTTALRYRAGNLILSGMPPGPTEPTADQLQHYLRIIVDDLIMLYEQGILVKTPEHPDGIRVRVALVAIIADHPAMCKLCGFADHGHNAAPCTKCTVPHDEFFTDKSLCNEFPARDGEEHRRLSKMYRDLPTTDEKEEFFTTHGVRWTEFARLDYFDLVRYTIIDPMHNLLLGIAKTQWYTRWIKSGCLRGNTPRSLRELNIIHNFLESFESPLWAGRLPLRVGEPAGGSLTADEYKFAVTGPWAVAIPLVWERFLSEAEEEYENASARHDTALEVYQRKKKAWERGNRKSAPPSPPKAPVLRMLKGEDENFLRFATALKILAGSSIKVGSTRPLEGLEKAKRLLKEYLLGFSKLYGMAEMKPNHHWAVHIPAQVVDYGPLYSFWAFLTERLNKILKNLNTNNWTGGQLEVSMMRQFHQMAQLDGILNGILDETSGPDIPIALQWEHKFIRLLLGTGENKEALGTIQDAAAHERNLSRVIPGTIAVKSDRIQDDHMRLGLVNYYNRDGRKVHLTRAKHQDESTEMLGSFAETYNYALLDGRRVTPTTRSKRGSAGSSLIQIQFNDEPYAGEIRVIFRHKQTGVPNSADTLLAFISWMKPSSETPLDNNTFIWHYYPELGVDTWEYKKFAAPTDTDCPPSVLPLADIQCQVARGKITYTTPPLWITTTMDRFPSSLLAYGYGSATANN